MPKGVRAYTPQNYFFLILFSCQGVVFLMQQHLGIANFQWRKQFAFSMIESQNDSIDGVTVTLVLYSWAWNNGHA